jgi:hypothetical protein
LKEREREREIEEIQKSVGSGKSGDKAGQAFESKDKDSKAVCMALRTEGKANS